MFSGFINLISISIPNNLKIIGNTVFSNSHNLETITLPNSLKSIGKRVFEYCAKLNNIVLELLIELAEHHSIANPCSEIDAAKNNLIKSVIIYTRENYDRKITLDEIAKSVHYDKYALCREYKKYTGQTIIDDLNHYRCIKATELLKKGTSVSDTADKCGFANLSYFGKTFKKHIGHSPSKFQKKF